MGSTYLNQLAELEAAFFEKQQFGRELENHPETYRYYYQQAKYSEPINMTKVDHLLEQYKDNGIGLLIKQ